MRTFRGEASVQPRGIQLVCWRLFYCLYIYTSDFTVFTTSFVIFTKQKPNLTDYFVCGENIQYSPIQFFVMIVKHIVLCYTDLT